MIMKIKTTITAILLASSITSCSNWLDVTPSNVVVEDEMFREASGYHNAINGLYKKMAGPSLYGRELSYGFVEVLSQNYVKAKWGEGIGSYSPYYTLFEYKYDESQDVKDIIERIWKEAYSVIANANNIIKHIPNAQLGWFACGQEEKNLIMGEALAVRAMMHFEMLRLFAPAPIIDDSKAYIPYITEFPYYGNQAPENTDEILKKIEKDLIKSKELIASFDTQDAERREKLFHQYRFGMSMSTSYSQVFYEYRGYRANIMAVTALMARVYNYWGKHQEAFVQAEEVEGFSYSEEEESPALVYSNDWNTKWDRKFTKDLIFALSDKKMLENYSEYANPKGNTFLLLNKKIVKFENSPEADAGDNRLNYLISTDNRNGYTPLKFIKKEGNKDIIEQTTDMLPMIRLSEMHLIMAESAAKTGDWVKANEYINKLRVGRNCKEMDLNIKDMNSFLEQLLQEVRKEFFSEGQTFFYFKKYNQPIVKDMQEESFTIPVPEREKIN